MNFHERKKATQLKISVYDYGGVSIVMAYDFSRH